MRPVPQAHRLLPLVQDSAASAVDLWTLPPNPKQLIHALTKAHGKNQGRLCMFDGFALQALQKDGIWLFELCCCCFKEKGSIKDRVEDAWNFQSWQLLVFSIFPPRLESVILPVDWGVHICLQAWNGEGEGEGGGGGGGRHTGALHEKYGVQRRIQWVKAWP